MKAPHSVTATSAERALVESEIKPTASEYWRSKKIVAPCDPGEFTVLDVVKGSFTIAHANQEALLYRYCTTGHNLAKNGIGVFESGHVVAHVVYQGGWDSGLLISPDIDGSGRSPILIVSGGTNMGETWQAVSIIELTDKGVMNFGVAQTYGGSCQTDPAGSAGQQKGGQTAYRLFAKKSATPAFFHQAFTANCREPAKWVKSGILAAISLRDAGRSDRYIRLK